MLVLSGVPRVRSNPRRVPASLRLFRSRAHLMHAASRSDVHVKGGAAQRRLAPTCERRRGLNPVLRFRRSKPQVPTTHAYDTFAELVEYQIPLQQSGMGMVLIPELAAAVADSGAVGVIALPLVSPNEVAATLIGLKSRTAGTVRINFLIPFFRQGLHGGGRQPRENGGSGPDPGQSCRQLDRYCWDGSDRSLSIRWRSSALRRAGVVESTKSTRAATNCSGASI